MVKMAKDKPFKFILLFLSLLLLYVLSGTDLFSVPATGQNAVGAIRYIHADLPTTVQKGAFFDVHIALVDQLGNPITGRGYGGKPGQFNIQTNGIKNINGVVARFDVDDKHVRELEQDGQGTGVYVVPVIIAQWVENTTSPVYTLEAGYTGDGAGSADEATDEAYRVKTTATFVAEGEGKPEIAKWAPVQIDKGTLAIPALEPGQTATQFVTFRVKPVAQARNTDEGTRKLSGLAANQLEMADWIAPVVFDNTGKQMEATFGSIKEEEIDLMGYK
ncbi:MAG: hypothetical protein M1335_03445, partial [Chloroflexi bacterium]|nr:hypothetical protein [Chloroflexota bacterium]